MTPRIRHLALALPARQPRGLRVVPLLLSLIATLVGAGLAELVHPPIAFAASCSPATHCYGRIVWQAGWFSSWHGASTAISVAKLSCATCYDSYGETGFIDDEIWFADESCDTPDGGKCNIEMGYSTYNDQHGNAWNAYFWADDRQIYGYYEHPLAHVPSADIGHEAYVTMQPGSSSSRWDVRLTTWTYYSDNTSVDNPMTPGTVRAGQELGMYPNQASAPYVYFTENQYEDTSNHWHYFTSDGSFDTSTSPPPPYAGYIVRPSQSSTGGSIYTLCC